MNILKIKLLPICEQDLVLWDKWEKLVDFSIYQTYLFPQGFNKTDDYLIFIIQVDLEPVGAIWLEEINYSNQTARLGLFIGDPNYWNKGIGSTAITMIINNAFNNLGLKSIFLNVREKNHRAIQCYKKVGFKEYRYLEPRKFGDGSVQGWFEMVVQLHD